ncbi:hypothetical protein [Gulosibacter sp. 10]|uniref:PLDc N-terminal domain-containing protein n=1 Tax=Gulosibacter sp. 10 TaxID=1255570 RepID=UPI00097EF0FC|nr:hypothetical protein [Gulosibacter sp. 10]SJM59613.1 hypothetical protein FM112_06650 [Gulosibacter sp. 10]
MAKRRKKRGTALEEWQKLGDGTQATVAVLAGVQVTLFAIAQLELVSRARERVRGRKWTWFLGNFVNFLGPISFLLFGRRRSPKG